MSFTATVKDEVSKIETTRENQISELSAIIQNSNIISKILITTENSSVARRIYKTIKDLYNINPKITVRKGYNYNKKLIYILEIKNKVNLLINDLGIGNIPHDYIISDDDLKRCYLRGVFLMVGSINDPKTSRYHLEFNLETKQYSEFIKKLLNNYDLNSKVLKRKNRYMVYIKEAEKIGDFLRIIGAINSLLYFEDIRIYRDHKNMTNRLNNCEQANVDKMIDAAAQQINQINIIEQYGSIDLLGEKERMVAFYRKKYPEASLQELSEIISIETETSISKSGLYHRFNKIKLLSQKIKENQK